MSAIAVLDRQSVISMALSRVGDIATLPEITVKIIEMVEDAKSTARDLHQVIKKDPALSAKVLKVVNSAFYGLPGQVASVDRAIILLGLSAVKNIAIAASIARLFKGGQLSTAFTAKDLWRHSVAVGVTARLIAKTSGMVTALDEVFLAGLIHDLGLMVERQAFAEKLGDIIDQCAQGGGGFVELENQIIGADHQGFGDALTTKWRFPRHLRAVVGFHHYPEMLSEELQPLGRIIQAADILCCGEQLGFYLTASGQELTSDLLDAVGVTFDQIQQIREQLHSELADAEATLTG